MQTEIRCSAGISVELLDWVVLVSAPCSSSPSKGTTSTLAHVECRFDHTALAARPLHSAFSSVYRTFVDRPRTAANGRFDRFAKNGRCNFSTIAAQANPISGSNLSIG
jgi:hypothetical protein